MNVLYLLENTNATYDSKSTLGHCFMVFFIDLMC